MNKRGQQFGAALALLMIGALAACGGGKSASPSPASTPIPTPTPTAASTPSPNPSATFTPLPSSQGASLGIGAFTLSGGEQSVLPPGSVTSPFVPDEQIAYLRQPDGTYNLWTAAGGTYGTYRFSTPDLFSLGAATTVLTPSGPGTPAFDADYLGSDSVFPAANGTDLLMVYDAENHLFSGVDYQATPFYAGIGLARSHDGGQTWVREGEILSGHDPQQPTQAATGAGAFTASVVQIGGYVYAVFRENDVQSGTSGYVVARAPLSGDAAPGTWQKYYQGSFSTPGLGGAFTPLTVVLDPTAPADERQPNISFNVALNQFVMTTVGNGGIYILTSPDLITWSSARVALAAPIPDAMAGSTNGARNWYPTLITPSLPSNEETGATGYLYYAKFLGDGTPHHFLYRQAFTIVPATSTQSKHKP